MIKRQMKYHFTRSLCSILYVLVPCLIAAAMLCNCQNISPEKSDILEDYDYFISQLEAVHPDPYTAFGGEKAFHRKVKTMRRSLAVSDSLDASELQARVAELLVPLHDGHTYCGSIAVNGTDEIRYSPISLQPMSEGFFVWSATDEYGDLLGAKLESVGGLNVDALLGRLAVYATAENTYGLYGYISGQQINSLLLSLVLDGYDGGDVEMHFTTPENVDTLVKVRLLPVEEANNTHYVSTSVDSRFPSGNFEYKWADKERGIMAFKSNSIISRDCLEYMRDSGMGEYESTKSYAWGDMPLEDIPSIASRFGAMLQEMKAAGAQHLIIDLRGNGGGWTPIVYATLYQLFGDEFLAKDMDMDFETKVSELYLQKMNLSLEEFNEQRGAEYSIGDFIRSSDGDGYEEIDESTRESVINSYMCIDKEMLLAQGGDPLYRPEHIYVVTNPGTFSAAFHYAYMLWKMGATLVGVPSGQAPNTFMEVTPFKLPHSGIECSVSNSIQRCFSDDDPHAHVLWPDWMPTWEEYRDLGFDSRADLVYILDKIG